MKRICAISFVMEMSGMLCLFSIPLLAVAFRISSLLLGFLVATGVGTYMASAFVSGHLADRVPARFLAGCGVLTISGCAAAALAACTVRDLFLLVAGLNVGFGLFWAPFMTIVNRVGGPSGAARTVSLFSFAWSLGGMAAPFFGGFLFQAWNRLPFVVAIGGFCIVGLWLAVLATGESRAPSPPAASAPGGPSLAVNFIGLFGVFVVVFASLRSQFPKLADVLAVSPAVYGLLCALTDATRTAVFFLAGRHERWFDRQRALILCVGAGCLTLLCVVFSSSVWFFIPAFAALGAAIGVSYALALHSVFHLRGGAGAVLGRMEATLSSGMLTGSLIGGFAARAFGLRGPYAVSCGLGLLFAAVQLSLLARQRRRERAARTGGTHGIPGEVREASAPAGG